MISEVIWIVLLVLAGAAGWFFSSRSYARGRDEGHKQGRLEAELGSASLTARVSESERRLAEAEARVESLRAELQEALNRKSALETEAARLPEAEKAYRELRAQATTDALALREAMTELQILREGAPRTLEAMRLEFASIAERLLKEKGTEFTGQNKLALESLLNPLRERIQQFEKKVDDTHKEGRDQHVQLKTQIEGLFQMNQRLSLEAQNLTTALKGENKKGGNWGEVVLERVLESSGLEKGREYRVQPSYAGETGLQRPDIVIDLPDNRHLVIDSKLSLVAYERYCAAETAEAAEIDLDAHIQSIRQHIDGLSAKKYQDIHALNSVDFVFLFMPVEPAFIEASKKDPALFQAAFARNIVLVSPSTLLATLRTVASIWKQENQNRNVREIARQAVALYEKFVGFLADLDKVGKSIATAQETFNEARAKLAQGKGNLVSRVENLRKLGAKSDKSIPAAWTRHADEESGDGEEPAGRAQESLTLE
jgi:DNA recombination protein RmuC